MDRDRGDRFAVFFVIALMTSIFLILPAAWQQAKAKVYIDIDSPAFHKLPIAVADFAAAKTFEGEGDLSRWFSGTLSSYLDMTGFFNIIDRRAFPSQTGEVKSGFSDWKAIGAEYLATGSFSGSGRSLTVEFRLYDVIRGELIAEKKYAGRVEDREAMVSRFAGEILSALTGGGDIFATEIAFVLKKGLNSEIYRITFSGSAIRRVTDYDSLTLSPRWSPDGKSISFTSYREGNPDIYIRELNTGVTKKLVSYQGLNLPGAWSPDGKKMLITSNKDGNGEIYVLEMASGKLARLTNNPAIDVSPVWSPDGTRIAFVSNRSGSPQIYLMDGEGGNVRRLTFTGSYNTSPSWCPQANRIAYESRTEGSFHIFIINEDGSNPTQITPDGGNFEAPTWSPDGRYLAFSARRSGRSQLCVMNANGTNMRVLFESASALIGPSWSPYLR